MNWRAPPSQPPPFNAQDAQQNAPGPNFQGGIPEAPTSTAFTGVITTSTTNTNRVESPLIYASRAPTTAEQGLEAKPRPHVKGWLEGHVSQKQQIAMKDLKDMKVVIGDSIIKHLDMSNPNSNSLQKSRNI